MDHSLLPSIIDEGSGGLFALKQKFISKYYKNVKLGLFCFMFVISK